MFSNCEFSALHDHFVCLSFVPSFYRGLSYVRLMFLLFQSLDNKSLHLFLNCTIWTVCWLPADAGCLVLFLALAFSGSLRADEKIPEMEGRNSAGRLFLITTGPSLTWRDLDSDCLWYSMSMPYSSTIRQLIVTPTDSQTEQYSSCFPRKSV